MCTNVDQCSGAAMQSETCPSLQCAIKVLVHSTPSWKVKVERSENSMVIGKRSDRRMFKTFQCTLQQNSNYRWKPLVRIRVGTGTKSFMERRKLTPHHPPPLIQYSTTPHSVVPLHFLGSWIVLCTRATL